MRHRTVLALTLAALVFPAVPAAAEEPQPRPPQQKCAGKLPTIVGTSGSDDLTGTDGPDVVLALGGDDFIDTGAGQDTVCSGGDFDHVATGAGQDRVLGGAGDDAILLGKGADVALGQRGTDSLFGGPGEDVLRGGAGTSFVIEALIGGPGSDVLRGGPGLDTAQYFDSPRGVRVNLSSGRALGHGTDKLVGIEGAVGSNHDDVLLGDDTGNGLYGQAGNDVLRARGSGTVVGGGADVLSGDLGDDEVDGGPGEDLVTFGRTPLAAVVDLGAGTAEGHGSDMLLGIEAVQGSRLADTLIGGPADDLLLGNLGDDKLDGAGGSDTAVFADLIGPVAVDLRAGSSAGEAAGNDSLTGIENLWSTGQDDVLHGDDAANRIDAGAGNDLLVGYGGVDLLDGSRGTDECQDEADEVVNCEVIGAQRRERRGVTAHWLPWLDHRGTLMR